MMFGSENKNDRLTYGPNRFAIFEGVNRLFHFSVLCLFALCGCAQDDSSPPPPTFFVATIDGEFIEFRDPKVFIKREDGFPVSQEITAQVMADNVIERTLSFRYAGELSAAGTDSSFTIITGVYYENDYSQSWVNTSGPGGIDLVLNGYPFQTASGVFSDFIAASGGDSLYISDISFGNIPIRYADF